MLHRKIRTGAVALGLCLASSAVVSRADASVIDPGGSPATFTSITKVGYSNVRMSDDGFGNLRMSDAWGIVGPADCWPDQFETTCDAAGLDPEWDISLMPNNTTRNIFTADELPGRIQIVTVRGGSGRDLITNSSTGPYVFIVYAGNSRDTIDVAGGTTAWVQAGSGNDEVYAHNANADYIDCGAGFDTVDADSSDTVGSNCEDVY